MRLLIYGAKSLALGAYRVIQEFDPSCYIPCFLVTSLSNNPSTLAGIPVWEISEFSSKISPSSKDDYHILIAVPEDQHPEIIHTIKKYGYCHYICMDSRKESEWMELFFSRLGRFPSLHNLRQGTERAKLIVVMAQSHNDRGLKSNIEFPSWIQPLQVGAALTDIRLGISRDNTGENISPKNLNYCELTALYWLWKNRLELLDLDDAQYYGLFHYRRSLDITDADLLRLMANDVDVVLPFPTLHEPDILEHHHRYISESDWLAMKKALAELCPEYARALPKIFEQPFFYNCNIILAKKRVLSDYCGWLFPILARVEELSEPKGWQREDRYIGYLGENLMTLYFFFHKSEFNLYHTGRLMLT